MADNLNSTNKKISTLAFFGGDVVERYRQELIAQGKIPGTDLNATPEERKEGFNLYRKNKVDFKTFVEKVLMKKNSAGAGRIEKGGALVKAPSSNLSIVKKKPEEANIEQPKSGFDEILKILNSIVSTLKSQFKVDKKQSDIDKKQEETDRRTKREEGLEGFKKGISAVSGVAKKILAPFQSIIDRIWRFIFFTLLGRAFTQLLDWLGDKKNKEKIDTLGRFIKDWWPTLLGAVVLFLTPFGKFVRGTLGIVGSFAGRLVKLIPQIANAIKGLALNPWVAVPAAIAGTALLANEITGQRKAASVQAQNKAKAQTGKGLGVQGTDTMTDKVPTVGNMGPTTPYGLLQGAANGGTVMNGLIPGFTLGGITPSVGNGYGGIDGNTGQKVSGLGVDTQMIAARPGEIVMNKETVDAVGADTFLGLNRQYGGPGANKPKMSRVYSTGGVVERFATGGMVGGGKSSSPSILSLGKRFSERNDYKVDPTLSQSIPILYNILQTGRFKEKGWGDKKFLNQLTARLLEESSNFSRSKEMYDSNPNDPPEKPGYTYFSEKYGNRGDIGNKGPDDGYNFRGRGAIQLSGRSNYEGFNKWLKSNNYIGFDVVKNPDLLASNPKIQALSAIYYLEDREKITGVNFSNIAKKGDTKSFVYNINGGYNGLSETQENLRRIQGFPNGINYGSTPNISKSSSKASPKNRNGFLQNLVQQSGNFVNSLFGIGSSSANTKGTKKQGGGPIGSVKENTGMNIAGATADRQQVNLQPGEYILPKMTVNAIGGEKILNTLVAMTDSNSNAARLGRRSSRYTPGPLSSKAGRGGMITLPPITQSSGGGMKAGAEGTPEIAFSAVSPSGAADRSMNASIYGIVG
jgi:hypothetical protein